MAFHHAAIVLAMMYVWLVVAGGGASGRREGRPQAQARPQRFAPLGRPGQPRVMRPTRGLDKYLVELSTARGYGKRAVDAGAPLSNLAPLTPLSLQMPVSNKYLYELMALESIMRRMGIPRNFQAKSENMLLE